MLKDFPDEAVVILTNVIFLILNNEMCNYLEGMHNLSEAIFSTMLHNHAWVKDPLKFQKTPMEFSATGYEKLIDMVIDSTLQIIFKKLKPANVGIVPKKNSHNYLRRLLKYSCLLQLQSCARPDLLSILQPKQHFTTD